MRFAGLAEQEETQEQKATEPEKDSFQPIMGGPTQQALVMCPRNIGGVQLHQGHIVDITDLGHCADLLLRFSVNFQTENKSVNEF